MLIDWFTVVAQALNFVLLAWLMKRFLYKPILNAIDAREKRIAKELADAAAKEAEAKKERDEFRRKNEEIDQQRSALLSKVTDEANVERQRLLDEARKSADDLGMKLMEKLKSDALSLNNAIRIRTQHEVFSVARKALIDLAATSLEARMTDVLILRLREMDTKVKAIFAETIKTASQPVLVRSAFDLANEQRFVLQKTLDEIFLSGVNLRFETAPDLISGIELSINGQKIAWSIKDYIASLQNGIDNLLKEKERYQAKAVPKPEIKSYGT